MIEHAVEPETLEELERLLVSQVPGTCMRSPQSPRPGGLAGLTDVSRNFRGSLAGWRQLDTTIVLSRRTGGYGLCGPAGRFLVLRRQSMMGDALATPCARGGLAFLLVHGLSDGGLDHRRGNYRETELCRDGRCTWAIVIGILTAFLTETIQRMGRVGVERALGVVFTSLFALGLVLVRHVLPMGSTSI